MSEEEKVLLMLRGAVASASAEEQAQINECADKLRALIAEAGELGIVALGLVGAELAAKEG